MKKKFSNILIIIFLIIILYNTITNSFLIKKAVLTSFDLWKNNIFPYLFPFFIISDLLININIIELINKYLNKWMYKLFKINSSASFVFFMSILSGIPSNSKYINSLIKTNNLNTYEAEKILLFTHFVSPLFILGYIGNIVGRRNSIIILCIHYITNIILGFIFRNYHINKKEEKSFSKMPNSLIKTLTTSILNSINTLLLILGVIVFFSFLTSCISLYIKNPILKALISGFLEITNGINNISLLNISLREKLIFIMFIISFGGFSSHIQIMSILEEYKIRYKMYLISRILHAFISTSILLLLI